MKKIIPSCPLVSLTEEFIRNCKNGKRRYGNGKRISAGTIQNYAFLLRHLQGYEVYLQTPLRVVSATRLSKKQFIAEKRYWKKFYTGFSEYMHRQGCFDNYVGNQIKNLRAVLQYAQDEKMIGTAAFRKELYVVREEVPITTLTPERLQFLIHDDAFLASLYPTLKRIRDVFVVGCTVALRFSDLIGIRWRNIERVGDSCYLAVSAIKTGTGTRVRLPDYAIDILNEYRDSSTGRSANKDLIFPSMSLSHFNIKVRELCELAGWTEHCGKYRLKNGKSLELKTNATGKAYRLCDLMSSHVMRRTAITTMLMNGVPEFVVRKISGHSPTSPAFQRYVNLVQAYMDAEIDKHYAKLSRIAPIPSSIQLVELTANEQ